MIQIHQEHIFHLDIYLRVFGSMEVCSDSMVMACCYCLSKFKVHNPSINKHLVLESFIGTREWSLSSLYI